MSLQLSRYLKDFSAPRPDILPMTPKYFADLDGLQVQNGPGRQETAPAVDIDAERRSAFDEGHAEATIELEARHDAALAEQQARHAAQLESLEARYETEIATMIATRYTEMTAHLGVLIGDQLARVLAPVMNDALVEKAVSDLASMIAQGVRAGEACAITVKGPATLFARLRQQLGEDDFVFRHQETADTDLSVEYGDTILVTRMAVWSDAVRKVLA